jgi:SAM-dependent methyltransferase
MKSDRSFLESARLINRGLRSSLKRVPFLPGLVRLNHELKATLFDGSGQSLREFEDLFQRSRDPFDFAGEAEQLRFKRAEQMLDAVRKGERFPDAIEIGCAEGCFTLMLAPRCERLLAVDFSPTALGRARASCRDLREVEFRRWDLRSEPLPGKFDLIVVGCVLEYILRPRVLRHVRTKLVAALRPAGFLLLGNTLVEPVVEASWWGRRLMRGSWTSRFIVEHPELTLLDRALHQIGNYRVEQVLLRKRS